MNENRWKSEKSFADIISTTFFEILFFKFPIYYRPKNKKKIATIIDAYFLTKKSQKLKKKIGFTGVHLQNCDSKSDFFGEGHFHKSGGGHFAYNISSEWYFKSKLDGIVAKTKTEIRDMQYTAPLKSPSRFSEGIARRWSNKFELK